MLIMKDDEMGHRVSPSRIKTYGMKIAPYEGEPDISISCISEEGQYRVRVFLWTPHAEFTNGLPIYLSPLFHLDSLDRDETVLIQYGIFKKSLQLGPSVDRLTYFSDIFESFIAERITLHIAKLGDVIYILGFTGETPDRSTFCGGGSVPVNEVEECIEYHDDKEFVIGSMEAEGAGWVYQEVLKCGGSLLIP